MQLLFLLLLLVVPFLVLTLVNRFTRFQISSRTSARVGLSLFFLFTSLGHVIKTEEMTAMLPPAIPYREELIYFTGLLELLGAIGVWIPGLMRLAGVCLILMLLGVLPSNIYSAISHVDFGGHGAGPAYLLVRVPFQLFVIWWTYFATDQHWFQKQRQQA
ncbi:MAG: DoxX family protein [Pyrinomonadaceae bacterium]|nr:DoxX family protein [Pyrinomonadaceae bacterium]